MNESVPAIAMALGAGALLGLLFFGGLYLTVSQLPRSRHPVLLALGSFAIRAVVVVAGFIWIVGHSWPRLAAALVGFVMMRFVALRVWGPPRSKAKAE
jgi:F1F0 ATPase subunit 2